jgi:nicotinate-nucleotide adenylyltransferase
LSASSSDRCGIFGGTFDPIHIGHVDTVRQVMDQTGLPLVRYIPAAIPPHRPQPGASAEARLAMVDLVLRDLPGMVADARELRRRGRSYTVDTVESLQAEFPHTQFSLILGVDALLGLDTWHRWQELLGMVGVYAMVRPGYDLPEPLPEWWQAAESDSTFPAAGRIQLVSIDPVDVSATGIREGIRASEDQQHRLHPAVWQYIQSNHLYE